MRPVIDWMLPVLIVLVLITGFLTVVEAHIQKAPTDANADGDSDA